MLQRSKFIKEEKIYLFEEEQEIFNHFFLIESEQIFNISLNVLKKIYYWILEKIYFSIFFGINEDNVMKI